MCMACGLGFGEGKIQYHFSGATASAPQGGDSQYSAESASPRASYKSKGEDYN